MSQLLSRQGQSVVLSPFSAAYGSTFGRRWQSGFAERPGLRNADGPAQAGDYVAITVLGATQVKVDIAAVIEAGQRLTVASLAGHARALRTVQGAGVTLDEGGPVLGVALEPAKDGLVWVMVNPQ